MCHIDKNQHFPLGPRLLAGLHLIGAPGPLTISLAATEGNNVDGIDLLWWWPGLDTYPKPSDSSILHMLKSLPQAYGQSLQVLNPSPPY